MTLRSRSRFWYRFARSLAACVGLISLAACAPLAPVPKPAEFSSARAAAPVWEALEARPERDEHLLLNEGVEALDLRLRAIDSARSAIELQTFLWSFDEAGSAVARHLLAAAQRGVRVRILVDDTFEAGRDASLLRFAHHENMAYRIYNPHKQRGVDLVSAQALNVLEWGRLDHRMHNKAMIVDGQVAIAGGRNIADEYFGLHPEGNFRDVELLLRGPVIRELSSAFDTYWNSPWSLPIDAVADSRVDSEDFGAGALDVHSERDEAVLAASWGEVFRDSTTGPVELVVDQPPQDNPAAVSEAPVQVAEFLEGLFDSASEEIVILTAYLIPTPELAGAVARAIERGVRIRMLTNSLRSNNHLTAHSAYRRHIRTLVDGGVELYEVRADAGARRLYMLPPTDEKELALHAKALLVDRDRVFIGSANLDPRSLRINTELGLLVHSTELNARLREAFGPDFSPQNAWNLDVAEDGRLLWRAGDIALDEPPADSFMQRIEDWFFSTLPIEDEL